MNNSNFLWRTKLSFWISDWWNQAGSKHTYNLLLDTYSMKVIGRNRDTTDICKLHSWSALRFYISSISSHQKDTIVSENNSTCVWTQQNLDTQVTRWTNLRITFCIDIHRNTHVYHMYTYIFRTQPVTIWIQFQNCTRAILSKLAQGRQRCGFGHINLLPPEGEFSFNTEKKKKEKTHKTPGLLYVKNPSWARDTKYD